jgi:hypothetical protein
MRRWIFPAAALIVSVSLAGAACSTTSELPIGAAPTTTTPPTEELDDLEARSLETGAAGIQALETLIDRLLGSTDTCAILTQRDVQNNQLDPTLFTSSAARQVLSDGLVQVFDHLIRISPLSIREPLESQKAIYAEVLQVTDRFVDSPGDPSGIQQIEELLNQPDFVGAQGLLNEFVLQNCAI